MTDPDRDPVELLDPRQDVVFRSLFGAERNVELLRSLLNALLGTFGDEEIVSLRHLPESSRARTVRDKGSILDLYVREASGREYIVEMQCESEAALPERALYYGARRLSDQLASAAPYTHLRPLVVILITNFTLFKELAGHLHRFELRGVTPRGEVVPVVFSNHLRLVTVELPKFHAPEPQPNDPEATQWLRFLKEGGAMPSPEQAKWETPALAQAREELQRLAADPELRELYYAKLRAAQDLATRLYSSFSEGREEGEAKATRTLMRRWLRARDAGQEERLAPLVEAVTDVAALQDAATLLAEGASEAELRARLERAVPSTSSS